MDLVISQTRHPTARRRAAIELGSFFTVTFAVSWALFAVLALARPWALATFGEIHTPVAAVGSKSPLWYLGVYTPGLTALALTALWRGRQGLADLLARYARGFRATWALVALLVFPLWLIAARVVVAQLDTSGALELLGGYALAIVSLRIIFDPGPIGEEIGWRGYALPRLMLFCNPFWSGAVLGGVWALWHLNAFLDPAADQAKLFAYGNFAWCAVCAAIVMTWLYVRAQGNLLICGVLAHLSLNALLSVRISQLEPFSVVAFSLLAALVVLADSRMRPWAPMAPALSLLEEEPS